MSQETAFEVGRLGIPLQQIADVLTASQKDLFVGLPALVGYWPMSGRSSVGIVPDHGTNFYPLLDVGTVLSGYDGNPFVHIGNGTNYLSGSTGGQVTGTEAWVDPAIRGITWGGWFTIDALPPVQGGLITRWGGVTNYGYGMVLTSAGLIQSVVSSNGSAVTFVQSPAISTGQWVFMASRFIPSTELTIFTNGVKTVNTTAIPAAANLSTQALEIGRYSNDNNFIAHARTRDVFICAAALGDELIEETRLSSVP